MTDRTWHSAVDTVVDTGSRLLPPTRRADLDTLGFATVEQVLSDVECDRLVGRVDRLAPASAGTRRLLAEPWCKALAARLRRHASLRDFLTQDHVAVQCIYFEKSLDRNWLVPMHQDLSIPVARRVDHAALNGWSEKEGTLHVQPPVEFLARLTALRVHLDDCGLEDGPLSVLPGSHRSGQIAAGAASEVRAASSKLHCIALRGDVLVMRPLLMHGSSKAIGHSQRRVLHFLYGPAQPPFDLAWPEVA